MRSALFARVLGVAVAAAEFVNRHKVAAGAVVLGAGASIASAQSTTPTMPAISMPISLQSVADSIATAGVDTLKIALPVALGFMFVWKVVGWIRGAV